MGHADQWNVVASAWNDKDQCIRIGNSMAGGKTHKTTRAKMNALKNNRISSRSYENKKCLDIVNLMNQNGGRAINIAHNYKLDENSI